jgi:hypothetical protein
MLISSYVLDDFALLIYCTSKIFILFNKLICCYINDGTGLFPATHITVAANEIYVLQQAIEVIRPWLVRTQKSVAITHHYALQLCNAY